MYLFPRVMRIRTRRLAASREEAARQRHSRTPSVHVSTAVPPAQPASVTIPSAATAMSSAVSEPEREPSTRPSTSDVTDAAEGQSRPLDLFGIDSSVYLSPGEGDWLLTQEHIDFIRNSTWNPVEATDDLDPHVAHPRAIPARLGEPIRRIYRASEHGWQWGHFLGATNGRSPLLLVGRVEGTGEFFAVAIAGKIDVTADNASKLEARTSVFKLKGPAGYRHQGALLGGSEMYLAGMQQWCGVDDITARGTTMRALLAVSGFTLGILPSSAGQRPPSVNVAMLHSLKRCHAFAPSSLWPTWERAVVHVPGCETNRSPACFSPASVRGWYFDLDELEAYALA
ncbi:unnamed protein product [Vitrella brassicaformis CCMP3155]|uniref:Uncharacterized protein n=1 Tax=Vitrella brassicaformis (strain CCMP3155) TaxID=1169540 RepID=A0A0G4GF39_VITBC|nr:unnamed protein product [Vitrella brassicaformis CCMP3155]|eukprot:CEM28150.1 unnamed protein product [Vitrella brassicaformis CCMP3155]